MKHTKDVKVTTFWILKNVKEVKKVEVITYRPTVLKTTMTKLSQFCCPKAIIIF